MFTEILKNNKGSAIIVVLALIGMLSLLGIMVVSTSNTDVDLSFNQSNSDKAFYIADAGVKHALASLRAENEWRDGFTDQEFNNGAYTVTVIDSTVDSTLGDTTLITSTGNHFEAKSEIKTWVIIHKNDPAIFKYAVFGEDGISMENASCTDSYNSDSTFASSNTSEDGDIFTNGPIKMKNDAFVGGNINTSDTGNITIQHTASFSEDSTSIAVSESIPPIPDSLFDFAEERNRCPNGITGTWLRSPGANDLLVENEEIIILESGVYFFDNIHLKSNSQLKLATDAHVTIYLTGGLTVEQDATVNNGGIPSHLLFYSKGTDFYLGNNTFFYGCFYGWNTNWLHENGAEIFGAVIAKSVQIKNGICIHYDRKLRDGIDDGTGYPFVVAWKND